ncbi:acyl carrier protein [Roseateles saccharophilus]|uniref:Acyl carrier protein n=1 Tax=Roseateles saccharophilus TaxID=304 RepID=A0A4V2VR58_ROSSA|nr:acyl carrier protein [Roseateles saccharophilus]MDG0831974.1 acyl carrier protein [Roseateles saccharophilus]TCU97359.1 acyl carrier protein [Roseateles saccharophilus]
MSNTLDQLCTIAQRELGAEALNDKVNTPFSELGMDSLGLVDFMFTVEDHFHVNIEHDRALQNPTLTGLAALVDELIAAKAEPAAAAA